MLIALGFLGFFPPVIDLLGRYRFGRQRRLASALPG
jgi:hypothetical protein